MNHTIEEMFKSKGVSKVFDEDGTFTKEALDKYDDIANEFFDGNIDDLDKLCHKEKCFKDLPTNVEFTINDILDDEEIGILMDKITDKLSDKYGFCVNDYTLNIDIKAEDINWDTSE